MYEPNPILIILAGGKSSRMGEPKGLLDYKGEPWILEQLSRFKLWPQAKVFIGLGYDSNTYVENIPWFKDALHDFYEYDSLQVRVCINPHPALGPFTTLQQILRQIDQEAAVAVLPVDVPLLNMKDLRVLLKLKNTVVLPQFKGKAGHPVLLHRDFWKPLTQLDPKDPVARLDRQIKKISAQKITKLSFNDKVVQMNLNSPGDWQCYKNYSE